MNPISGTMSKAAIPSLIEKYLNHDCFDYEIAKTAYAGHAVELATKAKDEGIDIVVAVGGDGTKWDEHWRRATLLWASSHAGRAMD